MYMYGTKRKICTIDAELFWRRRKYLQKNSQKLQQINLCSCTVCICKVHVETFANKYYNY